MIEIFAGILLIIGSFFVLLAGIGIIRMPDLYMRMSATTKAATFGVGAILLAAALSFDDVGIISRALIIIFFLLLTAPVAAHMLGRAGYFDGVPLWKHTKIDQLRGQYDPESHKLVGSGEETAHEQEPAKKYQHPSEAD